MDPITSVVIERVANLAADEVKLLGGTKKKAKKLVSKLNTIRPYLHDAELRAMTDPSVRGWLTRFKTALYEADDAIDEWNTKSQQGFTSHNCAGWNSVSDSFTQCTCYRQLALRHNIGKKIEDINNELADIANMVNSFKFLENAAIPGRGNEELASYDAILKARMTNSTKESVIGREAEIESLREMLVGESYSEKSEIIVISVFGPPGHGKTSLAKHMFHEVGNHFTKQIWVYAPDILDEKTVIKKMLDAVKRETGILEELEGLKTVLVDEFLKNNRLLLVIDDIWNVDCETWRRLCNIFNNVVTKGSRILVTTRHDNVAKDVCSAYTMHIGPLSREISLSILRNNVVLEGNDENLMEMGEKIVVKCAGVPLALTTIAGALRRKNTIEWRDKVLESEMWKWDPNSTGGILPALWFSYYHLSPQLKQCFRYCAIYPKGSKIVKRKVVPMWVAHGYILEESGKEMEDIGGEYFDELVGRSLFQNAEWDVYKNIEHCKMHDLVHDLARFVTKGEVLVIEGTKNEFNSTELPPLHCRILDGGSIDKSYIDAMGGVKKLRTFVSPKRSTSYRLIKELQCLRVLKWRFDDKFPPAICNLVHLRYLSLRATSIKVLPHSIGQLWNLQYLDLRRTYIKKLPESIKNLSNLRYLDLSCTNLSLFPSSIITLGNLRHLSLEGSELSEIPEAIGSLKLLRSLDLSRMKISKLPETIANLSHLQELLVNFCRKLSMLPKGICQLTGLKKLRILETHRLKELPEGIGRLTNLQRLDKFELVKKDDAEGSSNVEELKQLNKLCGELEIKKLEEVGSEEEAVSAHLELKRFLAQLWLKYSENKNTNSDDVLQALCPHFDLHKLSIEGYPGCKLPSWLGISSFSGLHELTLDKCMGCTTLPALGNLPQLRRLYVSGMPRVRRLTSDLFGSMHGFPKLESLSLIDMKEWEEWKPLVGKGEVNNNHVAAVDDDGGVAGEERIFTFPCLREFRMSDCPKLRSLPPIFGASLQDVQIGKSMDLSYWEWCFSINVETLSCCSAEWLNRLPSLPNLRRLTIRNDHVASELPNSVLRFSSLQILTIFECGYLKFLPEEMGSLKQLRELVILGCPRLSWSYEEGGEQRRKISHIPYIHVSRM